MSGYGPYRLRFMNRVGVCGDKIGMVIPLAGEITADEAMEIAAWLVVLARMIPGAPEFQQVIEAVEST